MTPEQWQVLTDRYRFALRVWRENADVRAAASLLGVSEREYCDRLVDGMPLLAWAESETLMRYNPESAWREARKTEGVL